MEFVKTTYTQTKENLMDDDCRGCGNIPSYADDATYVCTGNRENNQVRVIEILEKLRKFLNGNMLTINTAKTVLIEIMVPQRRTVTLGEEPSIKTKNEIGEEKIVKTSTEAVLLGGTFHRSTSWKAHVQTGEEALVSKLRKKLGMLKFIGKNLNKKGKLMLANGFILSKIIYLIPPLGRSGTKIQKENTDHNE